MPFNPVQNIVSSIKYSACVFVLMFAINIGFAQEYKQTSNGLVYHEKNGKFIFPGNFVGYDTHPNPRRTTKSNFIKDSNEITNKRSNVEPLSTNSAIVLNITVSQPTCGYASGSIIVEATNGTPPYTYTRIEQYGSYTQQTGNFPVAIAGTVIMRVTDANGLIGEQKVTLVDIDPGPVTVTPETIKVPSKCNVKDGEISLKVTGGVAPYTYSLDRINWQTSNTFSNLYQGLYDFYVKDANGCIGIYNTFSNFYAVNACIDNGMIGGASGLACGPSSKASIEMKGTNGPYMYSMDGVNYQADGNFSNLGPGIYQIFIKKANGEIMVWGFNRAQYCVLYIEYVAVSASCLGSNGELEVVASRGKAPYQYSIDGINYQTSNIFSNLSPGNYSVTVRDDVGTKSSIRATVFDKCPIVNAVSTAESCAGNDGAITAGGFRGTEPYMYSIDGVNFQTSPDFTGLQKGTYNITIRDDLGFKGTTSVTVPFSCLQMQVEKTDATCGLNNAGIKITASNGVEPYLYSKDGINFATANTFNNLSSGSYTVAVRDATNKIVTQTVMINGITAPTLLVDTIAASCLKNDGKVTLSVSGGEAPYLYSFNGVQYSAALALQNVRADSLIIAFVKDKNNCISSKSFKISAHCPTIQVAARPEVCDGKNATVTVTVSMGFGPYQYSIDGVNFQTSNVFSNLSTGNYTITVLDASMIKNEVNTTIAKSCIVATASIANETCGYANGSILVQASNGTAPYTYSIDNINFQTSNTFSGLKQGNYSVTVRDALLTNYVLPAVLLNTPGPVLTISTVAVSCINNEGKIDVYATGGKAPFSYSIDGTTFVNNNLFSGLPKGNYQVSVKDANGCTSTKTASIELVSDLNLTVNKSETVCEGRSVQLTASSNGTQYSWQPASTLSNSFVLKPIAGPVVSTRYFVEASKGICKLTDSIDVKVNAAPIAIAKGDTTICYGQNAKLFGEGGVEYYWNPNRFIDDPSSSNAFVSGPTATTTYQLKVVDALGCASLNTASATITVKPASKLFAGNDTSVAKGEALPLFAWDINNTGFVDFDWQPRTGLDNGTLQNPITILYNDITYKVTANTIEGCKAFDTIKITVFDKAEIFVPNGFTPNADGLNDFLKPIPIGIKRFNYFTVYNRWGEVVFSGTDFNSGWGGVFKGQHQPPGIYNWMVSGTDFKGNVIKKSGTVTLIR